MTTRFRSLSDPDSLRQFAQQLREGIYISTLEGRILDANPAFLELVGVNSVSDLGTRRAQDMFVDPTRRAEEMSLLEQNGYVREFEFEVQRSDGSRRTVLDTCYLTREPTTGEEFIHGIVIDITSRKVLEAQLRESSRRDALTGALNRRYLSELEERFDADPTMQCGCIFVDIDHFKMYNDEHGHQEGDEVLRQMTRFLMRYTRSEEAVLRFGGDEFAVIVHGASAAETKRVAERFRSEAAEHAPVPFSLGWSVREPGESVQALIERADRGMMAVRVVQRQNEQRSSASGG